MLLYVTVLRDATNVGFVYCFAYGWFFFSCFALEINFQNYTFLGVYMTFIKTIAFKLYNFISMFYQYSLK